MPDNDTRYLDRVPTKRDWIIPVGIAVMSMALSAYAAYSGNDKVLTSRVTAVETQQINDTRRLERIEDKVDRLLERVK